MILFNTVNTVLALDDPVQELYDACGPKESRGTVCHWVYKVTSSQYTAEIANTFSRPIRILLILIFAYLINRTMRLIVRRIVKNLSKQSSHDKIKNFKRRTGLSMLETSETPSGRSVQRAQTIGTAIKGVMTFVIVSATIFFTLSTYNVEFAPLFAGAGIFGVVIGFGAQSMIKDFLAGIFIIFEDWYGLGDEIDAGEASGTVEQVTLRSTRLRDIYGVVWYIPNGEIIRAGNKSQQWGRALLDIGVSLDTDLVYAQKVIKDTADELAKDRASSILGRPEVLGIQEIATDRILIRVIIKTIPSAQWEITRELRLRIKVAFDKAGIVLPMPSQSVTYTNAQIPFEVKKSAQTKAKTVIPDDDDNPKK